MVLPGSDDTFDNENILSSLAIPLTNSENGLSLLNQDDNDVLILFKNNVQNIVG
jgi:hypothetical protein